MPRSVLLVGPGTDLFSDVRQTLLPDKRFAVAGDLVHCDGTLLPLTNIYPADLAPVEWDGLDRPADMPDPREMSTLILECRDPAWIAAIGRILGEGTGTPIWVVDAADQVWSVAEIDPTRLAL